LILADAVAASHATELTHGEVFCVVHPPVLDVKVGLASMFVWLKDGSENTVTSSPASSAVVQETDGCRVLLLTLDTKRIEHSSDKSGQANRYCTHQECLGLGCAFFQDYTNSFTGNVLDDISKLRRLEIARLYFSANYVPSKNSVNGDLML
jgi:hypothetical protein